MKITKRELEILEKHFKIYEDNEHYELEAWTNGGVNMFIYIGKNKTYGTLIEQLSDYINCFDIDEEIDLYRQNEEYKSAFRITESVKDFENWLEFVKGILQELKKEF